MATGGSIPVFFAIERSDLQDECDILQIVMKRGSSTFNKYVNPTRLISKEMTKINHITIYNSQIYKDKVMKRSLPLDAVLEQLFQYLKKFGGPCTLIGHKYCFSSASLLTRAIMDLAMEKKFTSVIDGFTDTIFMFREIFPTCSPKQLGLHALAKDINLRAPQALSSGRSIKDNVKILEKLALHHFTAVELGAKRKFYKELEKNKSLETETARMSQAVCSSIRTNFFITEQVAEPQQSNDNALQKRGKNKGKEKKCGPCAANNQTENYVELGVVPEMMPSNISSLVIQDPAEEVKVDLSLICDKESIVTNYRSVKDRALNTRKTRKGRNCKKDKESIE